MSAKPTLVQMILNATAAGKSMLTAANASAQKTLLSLVKGDVGLGNVDNTSDANKPVSSATQTALDAKQATLVSGTNIKTINSTSLLGSGDIAISGSGIGGSTGSTDNRVLRADGTGAATLQNSPVTIDDSGNVTGVVAITTTGDCSITGEISWGKGTAGRARSKVDMDTAATDNASCKLYPVASGSNVASSFAPVPKGTGRSSVYKTAIGLFGTDYIVDQTNYELGVFVATGTKYVFMAEKGGTGVQRHIAFDCTTTVSAHATNANSAKQLHLDSAGMVGINTSTATIFQLDVHSANAATGRFYNSAAGSSVSGGGVFLNSPVPTAADQRLGVFVFGAINGTTATNCAVVSAYSSQAHTVGSAQGTYLSFWTVANGSTTLVEQVRIDQNGKTTFKASTTAAATLNVPSGTAPSSPVNGDIWSDGSNLLVRLGGVTYTIQKA